MRDNAADRWGADQRWERYAIVAKIAENAWLTYARRPHQHEWKITPPFTLRIHATAQYPPRTYFIIKPQPISV